MKALKAKFAALSQSRVARAAGAGGVALASVTAQADPTTFTIDTTSIVAVITGGVTTISAIGVAVLSLVVVIKLFKWAQRTL